MQTPTTQSERLPPSRPSVHSASLWRGMLFGFTPLALVAVMVVLAVEVTVLARQLFIVHGFLVEQQVVVLVASIALAVVLAIYAAACVVMLRRIGQWQRTGEVALANGALWALGVTALIVVLPVLVAVLLP